MDPSSSSSSLSSDTNVLDLSDQCLEKIFQHLDVKDLGRVADVCARFRKNAKACFVNADLEVLDFEQCDDISTAQELLAISKVLRNFGANVKEIHLRSGEFDEESRSEYQYKTLKLLNLYCAGTLIEINLVGFDIDDDIALMIRSVLFNLRELRLERCKFGNLFLEMLPFCAPELREMHFYYIRHLNDEWKWVKFYGLHQPFENLTKLTLHHIDDVKNIDIEEFLKWNPQVRQIDISACGNLSDAIYRSIGIHTPHIETLRCDAIKQTDQWRNNAKYFGQLKNLCSLETNVYPGYSSAFLLSAICAMGAGRVPLTHLRLAHVVLHGQLFQFIVGISQLKTLKVLKLECIEGLDWIDIHEICKHLRQLSELHLDTIMPALLLTANDLLETVRNAKKLEFLYINKWRFDDAEEKCFDVDMYLEMVEIVGRRREKIHLLVSVSSGRGLLRDAAQIPKKLFKRYENILTLEV